MFCRVSVLEMTFCQKLSHVLERSAYPAVGAGKSGLGVKRGRELQRVQQFVPKQQCSNSKPAITEGTMGDLERDN